MGNNSANPHLWEKYPSNFSLSPATIERGNKNNSPIKREPFPFIRSKSAPEFQLAEELVSIVLPLTLKLYSYRFTDHSTRDKRPEELDE